MEATRTHVLIEKKYGTGKWYRNKVDYEFLDYMFYIEKLFLQC
jgi:hypothetical protein